MVPDAERKTTGITVYTTPACPYCVKVKQWLDEYGYDYTEHNVAEDREKAKEMIQQTGKRAVPQIVVDDRVIIGFQPQKIERAITQSQSQSQSQQ